MDMVNMHRFSFKQTQSSSRPSWPWWPVNSGRLNFLTSGKFWCWFPSQCWPSLFLITAKITPWTALLEGFDNRDEADHDDGLEARQEDDHHQDEVQSGLFGSGDLAKFTWTRKLHSALCRSRKGMHLSKQIFLPPPSPAYHSRKCSF